MIKRILFPVVMILCFSLIVGCGGAGTTVVTAEGEEVVVLKFNESMTASRIKELDGKKVQMTGFIATSSPLDGQYVYLMNMPYHQSPFCVPNTNILSNTLTAYTPKGKTFEFTDTPIVITGTFKAGMAQDALGYQSEYQVVDTTYKTANVEDLEGAVKEYGTLANKGFVMKFHEVLSDVYKLGGYKELGTAEANLVAIDTSKITAIKGMFDGLDPKTYSDAIAAVGNLDTLVNEMNKSLEIQNYSSLPGYQAPAQAVFQELTTWVLKYSL